MMILSNQISHAEYPEVKEYYRKSDFDNWRNNEWWENGKWKEYLPSEEHDRWDKFYNQACKNVHNKYKKSPGYHFVEVLKMIELNKKGYQWLYENYHLFKIVRPTEVKFYDGTEKIIKIIGRSKINKLYDIVSSLQLIPADPDLFAYKKKGNGHDMIFIEVKRKDKLSITQLIGFELIKKYLNIPITVVRYFER
jgi:hypothetical protein